MSSPATTPDIRPQGSPPLTSTQTGFTLSPPTNPPSVDSQYFSNIPNVTGCQLRYHQVPASSRHINHPTSIRGPVACQHISTSRLFLGPPNLPKTIISAMLLLSCYPNNKLKIKMPHIKIPQDRIC